MNTTYFRPGAFTVLRYMNINTNWNSLFLPSCSERNFKLLMYFWKTQRISESFAITELEVWGIIRDYVLNSPGSVQKIQTLFKQLVYLFVCLYPAFLAETQGKSQCKQCDQTVCCSLVHVPDDSSFLDSWLLPNSSPCSPFDSQGTVVQRDLTL